MYDYQWGIDPGVNTGIALYDNKHDRVLWSKTLPILEAMDFVLGYLEKYQGERTFRVNIENPNKWNNKGMSQSEKLARSQGAGSVKRDFSIWKEFCEKHGVPMFDYSPRSIPKYTADQLRKFYPIGEGIGSLSEHARVAISLSLKRF